MVGIYNPKEINAHYSVVEKLDNNQNIPVTDLLTNESLNINVAKNSNRNENNPDV